MASAIGCGREGGWPLRRIAELVPDRWAYERGLLTQSTQTAQ